MSSLTTTAARGYGGRHQSRRRRFRAIIEREGYPCARGAACALGGWIFPWQKWDLGHADGISVGGPEHRRCNRATARWASWRRRSRAW